MEGSEGSVGLELLVDSSAAKSFVSKRGAGKMRHIEVRWFWLQEEVRAGRVVVTKVRGEWNPADLMTKYLNSKEIRVRSHFGSSRLGSSWAVCCPVSLPGRHEANPFAFPTFEPLRWGALCSPSGTRVTRLRLSLLLQAGQPLGQARTTFSLVLRHHHGTEGKWCWQPRSRHH